MLVSIIIGGVPLVFSVLGELKQEMNIEGFTYLFAGGLSILSLICSLLYTFIGMKKKFERLSEGD